MPLIARVNLRTEEGDAVAVEALREIGIIAERLGVVSTDAILPDKREREAYHDIALARLRRFPLAGPAAVLRHNCPHVAGSQEPTWGPCTDAAYSLTTTTV